MLQTFIINIFWYLAPLLMTGNRLGTKQTWVITRQTEVFSHLQWTALQQCVQCWPEPPSHHIETRHHHTRRFNAKWNTTQAMLDGGETWIWILGAWCETGPGWRWVVILQTWMEVRWDLGGAEMQVFAPGMRWGGTYMKVRPTSRALDGCGMGPAWSWDAIVGTWMSVRHNLHGGETWFLGPRCGWNRALMKVRHTSWDLDGDEMGPGWR